MDLSMARGLLMLSPRLMLIPTFSMEDITVLDMVDTMVVEDTAMVMDLSMARGLLMLSPRLMLIPTFSMEDITVLDMEDITDLAMPVMVDTGLDTEDTTG